MAEKAVFSSFRRPGPPSTGAVNEPQAEVAVALAPPPPAAVAMRDHSQPAPEPAAAEPALAGIPFGMQAALSLDGLRSDQLGLIHPQVITLHATLPGSAPVSLFADVAGIYRPRNFHPAPWSGFAYDRSKRLSSGLAAGTRVLTARGEIEVEALMPGDSVMTLRGPALLPISWIGRAEAAAPPIRIEPGALGPNIPRRTLCVGPNQPVYVSTTPVTAQTLVNGTTVRVVQMAEAELFQIDVGHTEVILAEGLAVSSNHGASARS